MRAILELRRLSKGNQVNIPEPRHVNACGNTNESEDGSEYPGKSSLFFLTTSSAPWNSNYSAKRFEGWQSILIFEMSGACSSPLENSEEKSRSYLVVLITASGLQGEQPLVDRTM